MISFSSVTDLKTKSKAIISHAQKGLSTIILRNNRPVAAVVPYVDDLEEILEEIGWQTNTKLHGEIATARRQKRGILSENLRKKLNS